MAKTLKHWLLVVGLGFVFIAQAEAFHAQKFSLSKVKLINQNMYLGTDLSPIFLTGDLSLIQSAVEEIIASNYPARAQAMAKVIKRLKPHVLCLQEAWIFEYLPAGISWNFKTLLLDALGSDYYEVVTNEELMEIDLRDMLGVRVKDQDVIIAHKTVEMIGVPQTMVFQDLFALGLPPLINEVKLARGLSMANLKIGGMEYTVANTHLEAFDPETRLSQAEEVVDEMNDAALPAILAGDFNAWPGWPAYDVIISAFDDAWPGRLIGQSDPGYTFGRDDLISDTADFNERIDFVFTRHHQVATLVGLTVGKTALSKTEPVLYPTEPPAYLRLWPSDHLGLFFILFFAP